METSVNLRNWSTHTIGQYSLFAGLLIGLDKMSRFTTCSNECSAVPLSKVAFINQINILYTVTLSNAGQPLWGYEIVLTVCNHYSNLWHPCPLHLDLSRCQLLHKSLQPPP